MVGTGDTGRVSTGQVRKEPGQGHTLQQTTEGYRERQISLLSKNNEEDVNYTCAGLRAESGNSLGAKMEM